MSLHNILRLICLSVLSLSTTLAVDLTPEQRAKLNSLPPDLRAQAMRELEAMNVSAGASSTSEPLEQPEVVRPLEGRADQNRREREWGSGRANRGQNDGRPEGEFNDDLGDLVDLEDKSETKIVKQELERYGYDLFAGAPTTFAPVTEIPVPVDYIIGPGDLVRIQFFGKQSGSYDVYVTREGVLQIPELGPLSVAGLTFTEMKNEVTRRISDQMMGVQVFLTMGELRSMRVFVLGDVNRPGSYLVSSVSTMLNALFVSGGIRPIGSLRHVELKRAGSVVATLDLYDLLLRGDTSNDVQLAPGDVLFVPPVGPLVGVAGEVQRPAIYEVKGGETFADLIKMAGGYTAKAYPPISQIERIGETGSKEIIDRDLSKPDMSKSVAQNGDLIRVYSTLDRVNNYVRLEGAVERPGDYQWAKNLDVLDLVPNRQQLLMDADLDYALIVSKNPESGDTYTRSFSFSKVFSQQSTPPELYEEDRIIVFRDTEGERFQLDPIIERLRLQSISSEPEKVVSISGRVRHPGEYPLDIDMTVSDLLRAAGGYTQDAYTLEAELLRFVDNGKTQRESVLLPINLASIEPGSTADVKLQPFDQVMIKRIPEWNESQTITLGGEFRFPGTYTIERGETLSRVIERAGGLTDLAHPAAAVFMRESLREAEAQQLAKLRSRLRDDVAAARLQEDNAQIAESVKAAEGILGQIEETEAVGRLVIDLPGLLAKSDDNRDITVRAGDELIVPQRPQAVTIIGSVNYPTSHLYRPGLSRDDYIGLSGGLLKNADKKRIYVVKANGQVMAVSRSRFFPRSGTIIEPGDTIVVPLDIDRMKPLRLWGEISQIVYQIALGVAAVNSL